ncbi:MAG: tripartite tricarboxylate transporter TctB family protein [Pseudomonadota bacterium]
MRNTHLYTGLLLIPVCIYCLFWFIPANVVPPTSEDDISPGLIPMIAVGTGLIMSVLMAFHAWRQGPPTGDQLDDEFGSEATGIDGRVLLNGLIWAVGSTIAWYLIVHVGFEPSMTLLLAAIMLYVGVRKPLSIALNSVLMPIVLSQAAWYFFTTEMPAIWR